MAQYLLSVWHDDDFEYDPDAPLPADMERLHAQVGAFNQQAEDAGVWVFAGGLQPAATASVARPTDGDISMTDGPYAESKELMGGFWVFECADLDAAKQWAMRAAAACEGPVEVRPFQGE